jgi:hypothetical protein
VIDLALHAMLLPAAVGVCALLLPRAAWSVEARRSESPWTAGIAVAVTGVLALWASEGNTLFELSERWQRLVLTSGVAGVGGTMLARCGEIERARVMSCATLAVTLTPLVGLWLLRMPMHDTLGHRLSIGVSAALASLIIARPSVRAPRWTALLVALAFAATAGMLLSVGSSKVAFAAGALALVASAAALLVDRRTAFSPGPAFAMASITMLAAFAVYGVAYQEGDSVPTIAWWFVAFSPLAVIASPTARRAV